MFDLVTQPFPFCNPLTFTEEKSYNFFGHAEVPSFEAVNPKYYFLLFRTKEHISAFCIQVERTYINKSL